MSKSKKPNSVRNRPCHCGSGKKFKICCMRGLSETEQIRQKIHADFNEDILQGITYNKEEDSGGNLDSTTFRPEDGSS